MENASTWDVVVIGGGPAGMIAAGRAAERGKRVLLLEKNPGVGKKLLITGGGRCNVTNNKPEVRTMLAKYAKSEQFLFSAFSQFAVTEALDFFHVRGMDTKEENDGRMFPASNKARSVWEVLVAYMKEGNVEIRNNTRVVGLAQNTRSQTIEVCLADKSIVSTKSCIVATGGTSHPETGSTGEAFGWLKKLGHTIIQSDASLVPIAIKDAWVKKISGVTLTDIKLTTYRNKKRQKAHRGKLLFTHFGVSGPTVLNMSREVGELLYGSEGSEYQNKEATNEPPNVEILLDLFPAFDNATLREKIQHLFIEESNKKVKNALATVLPPLLAETTLSLCGINPETPCHSVRTKERTSLISLLKSIPLQVQGLLGKDKAIISSGGVALEQVDFKTMESRVIPRIYLIGDVLTIDRPSGGYSLQLCWTTGYVAGNNC